MCEITMQNMLTIRYQILSFVNIALLKTVNLLVRMFFCLDFQDS